MMATMAKITAKAADMTIAETDGWREAPPLSPSPAFPAGAFA
jgi:hypothetical protein